MPVCRAISLDMFGKILDLDLKWHLLRKTGEVTRIIDRGTSAIQNVLSTGAPGSSGDWHEDFDDNRQQQHPHIFHRHLRAFQRQAAL